MGALVCSCYNILYVVIQCKSNTPINLFLWRSIGAPAAWRPLSWAPVHLSLTVLSRPWLDVANAYLNGTLEEKVFMRPPTNLANILESIIQKRGRSSVVGEKAARMLEDFRGGKQICHLQKSLYGIRQSGRSWHMMLDKVLRKLGAIPTNADPCVYCVGRGEDATMVVIYVDDILIMSRDSNKIKQFREKLCKEFEVKKLGNVGYCLGVEFEVEKSKITMHQRGYILDR
ncbi:hypothetical protein Zmor_001421 [Zophobas morio]|uniref:Reverse transcriptase Ty1/copia-type domain-containing protein n=1 Tax=Zophobas morio TaxID=2755281 RepID=A0AA38J3K4_9CUCU|nr:hypothetical protein Zmor_001421 [Zophobas morio]